MRRHRRLADRRCTAADWHHRRAWDDKLVERFTGRLVIRYDLRDAGRSTTVDPDSPGYSLRDLVADAVGVSTGSASPRVTPAALVTPQIQ